MLSPNTTANTSTGTATKMADVGPSSPKSCDPDAMLEHQHDESERRSHRKRVHDDRLDRHQHGLEGDGEHDAGRGENEHHEQRKPGEQVLLKIQRGRGIAADA